ncbi:HlyD family efflux transporter periplasmic adaptor subunit [Spirulina sp. CS-785/01]|uniref:HlyD family secretion protein n=1 Tax=Spirulina sp. CS-785/01 TaxID=3021716 RepID=UPI002330158F|nr:HlyD family efflux transporter periplasmic adaptor subunit [Spirulina sp. CS-785/01]MDB9311690.1 HlyD family efflux transporter periplasmic adaptor subunit [Spirulina sp. CS-785/01]
MSQSATQYQNEGETRTQQGNQGGWKKKLRWLIPVVLLLVGGGLGVRYYVTRPAEDALTFSGRIEGYESDVGAKVGGRVLTVVVREGDRVEKGQMIAKLDDAELKARLEGAQARIDAARQQAQQARLQLNVIQSQIRQTELNRQQAVDDTQGKVSQAVATVASAQAQLAQAQAQAEQARSDLKLAQAERDRYAPLLTEGVIPQQQFDQIQTRYETAQATLEARNAAVAAAQRQVNVAEGGLTQAQTSSLNPTIRQVQIEGLQTQLFQAQAQLEAAQADVKNAMANRDEIIAKLDDLAITSPLDGVVLTRTVEPGEVIGVGTTLLTVIDLDEVYLRGYIPEGEVGKVRVGMPAQVFLDSNPDEPLEATVSHVDSEASFTPENIYFKEDRVKQVFGLKVQLEEGEGYAKPGMPADGQILINDGENN